MRRSFAAMLSCVVVATFLRSSLLAADGIDSWSEKWVTVVEPDQSVAVGQYPPLSARVEVGDNFDVLRSDGTSLWVGRGWLPASEAIPYDKAIEFFSAQIARKPSPATYNLRATVYLKRADFKSAVTDANEALRRDPHFAPALRIRGVANSELGNRKLGLADLDEAIRCDPNFGEAYRSRGDVYRKSKDWDRAIAEYTSAIRLNPRDSKAFYNRGQAWLAKGSLDKAVSDMNDAVRRDPTDPEAYEPHGHDPRAESDHSAPVGAISGKFDITNNLKLAGVLIEVVNCVSNHDYDKGIVGATRLIAHYEEAEQQAREAAKSGKENDKSKLNEAILNTAATYGLRALFWSLKGDARRGSIDTSELVFLQAESHPLAFGPGMTLGRVEDEHALFDSSECIRRDPKNESASVAFEFRSAIYLRRGQTDEALADLDSAVRLAGKRDASYSRFCRAAAAARLDRFEPALADLDAAIRLKPSDANLQAWRAAIFLQSGKLDQALAEANKAVELDKKASAHYVLRGCVYRAKRQFPLALADFAKAAKLNPDAAEADKQMAWLLAVCPDPAIRSGDKAIQAALKACALTSCRDPDCLEALAAAYALKGDLPLAVVWQTRAQTVASWLNPAAVDAIHARRESYIGNKPLRDRVITR